MRDAKTGLDFMQGVAKGLKHRVQLTTDGHHSYLSAVPLAFENGIDYAQLVKKYGGGHGSASETRYSPGVCTGASKEPRLTNAFSKKGENLAYAVALHFLYYNWARPYQTLKGRTPAMAAGLTDRVWTIEDIVMLLEDSEARRANLKSSH